MVLKKSWLTGKTALITGAAKLIGRATALALAAQGVNIVIHYRASSAEAEAVAAEIREMDVQSWTIKANLREPEAAESLIPRAIEISGPIYILIN